MAENGIANRGTIVLAYAGGSVIFPIRSVKGLDCPERVAMWPDIINTNVDGSKETQFKAFRRRPIIDIGVVDDFDDMISILMWWLDNDRLIHYCTEDMRYADNLKFVPTSPEYESTWIQNVACGSKIILDLEECAVRTTWPVEV